MTLGVHFSLKNDCYHAKLAVLTNNPDKDKSFNYPHPSIDT